MIHANNSTKTVHFLLVFLAAIARHNTLDSSIQIVRLEKAKTTISIGLIVLNIECGFLIDFCYLDIFDEYFEGLWLFLGIYVICTPT